MLIRSFYHSFTSACRACLHSRLTKRMEGTAYVTTASMSIREACKLPKLNNRRSTPGSYPILTPYQYPMFRRLPSFCRPILRSGSLARFSNAAFLSTVTTRAQSYTSDSATRQQSGLESTTKSLDGRRARWADLLSEKHYESLISEVLDAEMPKYEKSTVINATDRVTHKRECLQILASPPSVLASAVKGDLVRRMQVDPSLQQEHIAIWERAWKQPSIYIHLLADRDGNAPTPNQLLTIRDFVIDYLSQGKASEHAWHIDKISRQSVAQHLSTRGYRKYLQTTSRSERRVKTLELFCQGIRKRCDETPLSLRDTPLQYPPSECGYSINSPERLAKHRAHQSSNYVMNLVEDICKHLYDIGTFAQHFTMHQFIIYLIFRQEQASIAEIFISGLLQVWVKDGGGLNAYLAGHSTSSAGKVTDEEWTSHERTTKLDSPMMENIRQQQLRAYEWQRALALADAKALDENPGGGSTDEAECM
jgi:hypothetical protein